ncbi:MAG TPA: choice-of-anchor tandem repeat NxxGxxAF-containing protein [Chthoniobacteraceae bacterium]|nr:choice-of-anchor tandem repeat NxxGxxAF-containing protein [Chthoniobacteraceae bacterium]
MSGAEPDTTPPVIDFLPRPVSRLISRLGIDHVPGYALDVIAHDDSGGAVEITQVPPIGSFVGFGITPVTITVRDAAGNTTTAVVNFYLGGEPPSIKTRPFTITLNRFPADEPVPLQDITALVDSDGQLSQIPKAGTLLPNGTTHVLVVSTNGGSASFLEVLVRVLPYASPVASLDSEVPGFDEQSRFASLGVPAIGTGGTIAFTGEVKPGTGRIVTALFRQAEGALSLIAKQDAAAGGDGVFKTFRDPLVNLDGDIAFRAQVTHGAASREEVWVSRGGDLVPIVHTGAPVDGMDQGSFIYGSIRDFALLDSGAVLWHATFSGRPARPIRENKGIWIAVGGERKLLLKTGDSVEIDATAAPIVDFDFAPLASTVGAQTRAFNSAGSVVLRVKLADGRAALVQVLNLEEGVSLNVIAVTGASAGTWKSIGSPAVNDNGAIAFVGAQWLASGELGRGLWRADSGGAPVLAIPLGLTEAGSVFFENYAGVIVKIGDPLINSAGQIAFWARTENRGVVGSGLWLLDDDTATRVANTSSAGGFVSRQGAGRLVGFDQLALSDDGIISFTAKYRPLTKSPTIRKGIFIADITYVTLLQSEGEPPVVTLDSNTAPRVRRFDVLTPVPGTAGQDRGVNANGEMVVRAYQSRGNVSLFSMDP